MFGHLPCPLSLNTAERVLFHNASLTAYPGLVVKDHIQQTGKFVDFEHAVKVCTWFVGKGGGN